MSGDSAAEQNDSVPELIPHAGGVSADEFRAALSRLAAGVVLITALDPEDDPVVDGDGSGHGGGSANGGGPGDGGVGAAGADLEVPTGEDAGMTATAFMSVSLDPPLVMVSVRNESRMDDILERQPLWAVSVLTESQRNIAGQFSMKGRLSDRLLFASVPHVRGEKTGAALVKGALATMECRTEQRVVAGDHTLTIGRVLTAHTPNVERDPLTYFRGRYRKLA
ncbi:flavin reductase family protein [Streptomyces sp. Ru73]|uniref:flavin reductase family protein n=1 Tax=Streptomyces sp. Ru73 TaxID=2080748 RepID=UPI00215664D0|nr:flavin reductase family protein [Streptomyces sp. Ru73]